MFPQQERKKGNVLFNFNPNSILNSSPDPEPNSSAYGLKIAGKEQTALVNFSRKANAVIV